MTHLPTLCMVNYDQDDPPAFRYRVPADGSGLGFAAGSPRQQQTYSLPNSPRYTRTAPSGESTTPGFPVPKKGFLTSKDDSYTTPYRYSSSTSITAKDKFKSQSHECLPLLNPTHPAGGNTNAPNRSYSEPVVSDPRFQGTPRTSYSLPPLKTMGETSLTANAELLHDPRWNEYLNAWVSGKQGTAFAYISFAGGFTLHDRGIFSYHPLFEDAPVHPCPRFFAHMHRAPPPKPAMREGRKKVNKKPEFWTWKGRTPISVPKPRPKKQVRVAKRLPPVPASPVTPTPPPRFITPTPWENVSSCFSADPSPPGTDNGLHDATESVPSEPLDDSISDYGSLPSAVKTPLQLLRLSSPPHTPSTLAWEEPLSWQGEEFEEDEDGNLIIPDALTPSNLTRLYFSVDYIEVLEPVVYGEALPLDAEEMSQVGVMRGLRTKTDPPLKIQQPWVPVIQDVDRIKIHSPPPSPIPAPKVPTPPPPKEPTPPPPPTPSPPPKSPTPPPPSPPPKPKRKPIVKKTKPPPKPPKCPTPKPPTPKPPTPKVPTPKPPTPTPPPPKEPTPPPPPPPKKEITPTPVPPEPTPTPTLIITPVPPTPTPSPPPEPTPEPERVPLPPAQKDPEFLAEMERQRLADLRRQRALAAFESLKQKKFVHNVKPIAEDLSFKDYGWLAQFCILKEEKVRMYKMAFDTVDEDADGYLNSFETLLALKGITGSTQLTEKEEAYIYRVLELADYSVAQGTDFRLFSIMAALFQKIASIEQFVRNVIEKMDLETLDWKMFMAKDLFNWCLDEETKRLKMDKFLIELRAGGVSLEHQREAEEILSPKGPLDMLDFLTYLPLFILTHNSVVDNPLDMSMDK